MAFKTIPIVQPHEQSFCDAKYARHPKQVSVDEFNRKHSIGRIVRYQGRFTRTSSGAFLAWTFEPSIMLFGIAKAVPLVEVQTPKATKASA